MKRLSFYSIPVIILLCFGLSIGISMLTGYWSTERAALPRVVDGSFDPYDIRGSYSVGEVMDIFGIPKEDFYTGLGLPSDMCATTQLKEFEAEIELVDEDGNPLHFGVSDVREWVAAYIGWTGPAPEETDHSTESADVPAATDPVQPEETATPAILQGTGEGQSKDIQNPAEHTDEWTDPRGGTPLSVVYGWGVSRQMLEQEYQINFDEKGLTDGSTLRDLATAAGTDTSTVRDYVSGKMKK